MKIYYQSKRKTKKLIRKYKTEVITVLIFIGVFIIAGVIDLIIH